MRKLAKLPEPEILRANASEWSAEYQADPDSDTKRHRYRHTEIKKTLLQETASKCIYCESKIGHNTPGDVEHKIPSDGRRELHFVWENLSIACTECNRRKNNYWNEGTPFLDPYRDDVESCVVHLGPIVGWLPGHESAEVTVRNLQLHDHSRMQLVLRKIEKIEELSDVLARSKSVTSNALRQALSRRLEQMKDWKSEYSAMVIAVCRIIEG